MFVFKSVLKQLYTNGSLRNTEDGFRFELKNRLMDAKLAGVRRVSVDGRDVSLEGSYLVTGDGRRVEPREVSAASPLPFELSDTFDVRLLGAPLSAGEHAIAIEFEAQPFGTLTLEVEDTITAG
jgi:hydroxymethylglutaryl-CoA reductase (NADPH)